jgi:hypothetical protein
VRPRRTTTAIAAACLALVGAGCGDEDEGQPIPAGLRQELESRLDETERRLDAGGGACNDIVIDTEPEVTRVLARIPSDVSADVRRTLEDGFGRLFELTSDQCDEQKGQETETETVEEAPPPQPEETVPEETVPTTPEPAPEEEGEKTPPGQEKKEDGNSGSGGQGGINVPGTGGGGTVAPGSG